MSAIVHPELRGDFHVHSQYSDDATSTMQQNIRQAAARGLTELRLIDHVRTATTWVPEYLAAVRAQPVPDGMRIFTGVEAKIVDATGALDVPPDLRVGEGGIDGIVIADHQFPGLDGPWSPDRTIRELAGGFLSIDALEILVVATIRAMEASPGGQLAHPFSILPKVGLSEEQLPDVLLSDWATAAASTGTLIEVNEKWACPSPRTIRVARAAGARIVASTDSHVAGDVGVYDRVVELLDRAADGGDGR